MEGCSGFSCSGADGIGTVSGFGAAGSGVGWAATSGCSGCDAGGLLSGSGAVGSGLAGRTVVSAGFAASTGSTASSSCLSFFANFFLNQPSIV